MLAPSIIGGYTCNQQTTKANETMATSASTLSTIIDELIALRPKTRNEAIAALDAKGLLPKKLAETKPEKKVTKFASKAAEEYAEAHDITIPEGFVGTANKDKISVSDLKKLRDPPKEKLNASPSAQKYARDMGIDITKITGSGKDGKVMLKDVKEGSTTTDESGSGSDSDSDKKKISPAAAKLMKQYNLDEDDITDIEGTGAKGTITVKDLKEIIELAKATLADGEETEEDE